VLRVVRKHFRGEIGAVSRKKQAPKEYLVDVIDKIAADWPADRVTELLPRAWLAARQAEQQRPGQAGVVAVT
jgi:hypothetical protein